MALDVIVVGGGPVGLSAAITARLAGLTVTVVEPRTGPIDKACGEGLMPGVIPHLRRMGVTPQGRPLAGIRYQDPHRAVEHRFRGGPGLGVRRTELHRALAERADRLGVVTVTGRMTDVHQSVDHVTVQVTAAGDTTMLTAGWLLGCDGLHSGVARRLGLRREGERRGRFGIRQHFAVPPWSDLVEVHFGPHAELYVTPVSDRLVGVAMLGGRGGEFAAALAAAPRLQSRLAGAPAGSPRMGAGPFPSRTSSRTCGRVMLVGDASGYVDALTGEGLRLGFAQAEAAIAALQQERQGDVDVLTAGRQYEREWRSITGELRRLTTGLVAWADSPWRGALVPAAAALPGAFGSAVEHLAR